MVAPPSPDPPAAHPAASAPYGPPAPPSRGRGPTAGGRSTDGSAPPLAPGFLANLRFDLPAGFLVFLVALPLCLGIATASRCPEPIVGVWTAVAGGVLAFLLSGSQLTIKGPAAGLIVVVEGAVLGLGGDAIGHDAPLEAKVAAGYPLMLGVGIAAGVVQILLGLFRAGELGELVPLTPVHGMLAAIGITIVAKQLYALIGQPAPAGEPIRALLALPAALPKFDPALTAVGALSLALLILFPLLKARVGFLRPVPAQLAVLVAAVPLGVALGLAAVPKALVSVPAVTADPARAFFRPDFSGLATATGVQYVLLFALVGSLESLLSSRAVDMLDPWRRKTDQNRDLLAVGAANALCAAVGALPMISEIVRSKANIDNGARTKGANLFHALFLLAFVLLLPSAVRLIPVPALAAMLVFTGFRLASPQEFVHTYRIGAEQLLVFVATVVVTLCTDLLAGVAAGVGLKLLLHVRNGTPLGSFFRSDVEVAHADDGTAVLKVRRAAVFSNWLGLKGAILTEAAEHAEVVLDLSATRLVDHSTMEKLRQLELELAAANKRLRVVGLEEHRPLSGHPLSARKGPAAA